MRVTLCALLLAAFGAGCVPVTEPLSDIEKADPDKNLVGEWDDTKSTDRETIDVPVVKGNPKGLMRARRRNDSAVVMWFFTTTIGKTTYANAIVAKDATKYAEFDKDGAFAEWKKEPEKRFFIFRYLLDGDNLTLDPGNVGAMGKLITAEKFGTIAVTKELNFAKTPAGWLAKYLDKTGPDTLFDGSDEMTFTRAKKK